MSAGPVSAGPAGVKNLRAMFENKSNDSSTSPPSRGRSPNGSVSSQPSRQVSKVRTSFVSVEKPGDSVQSPQTTFRKISDVSSMAELREEAIMEDNSDLNQTASQSEPINLGTILKGSPFETQTSKPVQAPQTSVPALSKAEAPQSPEKSKMNGVQGTNKVASIVGKMQSPEKPALKMDSAGDARPSRPAPGALNTKATASKSKDSPTSAKKSPVLQKKDSPTTPSNINATIKPKGGVNKITGMLQSSDQAKEERAKAQETEGAYVPADEVPAPSGGPTIKPRGGVSKITGIIQSSNKAKEERAKAEQSESANTIGKKQPSVNGGGSGIKAKGGVSKISGIIQSSNRAKDERAKAEQAGSAEAAGDKKATSKDARPPSMASKPTAASKAHAQKQDKSSATEQIKSPTTTRPTKLPSAATAGTAASVARKGAHASEDDSKATTSDRKSILPQAPRAANTPTRASLAKKSSRASLANGEDRPRSRVSAAHKPTDEGFLARMTRPTASSARRAQETQVGSPPRARQASANQENVKKPGRKSLGATSKPSPHADEANEILLEPVTENTGASMLEPVEHDEGEPGPAEEEAEEPVPMIHRPQPAEDKTRPSKFYLLFVAV